MNYKKIMDSDLPTAVAFNLCLLYKKIKNAFIIEFRMYLINPQTKKLVINMIKKHKLNVMELISKETDNWEKLYLGDKNVRLLVTLPQIKISRYQIENNEIKYVGNLLKLDNVASDFDKLHENTIPFVITHTIRSLERRRSVDFTWYLGFPKNINYKRMADIQIFAKSIDEQYTTSVVIHPQIFKKKLAKGAWFRSNTKNKKINKERIALRKEALKKRGII